ncbi:ribonuclease III [Pelovirga terrestris]|uniref:Ribonuclease 3 n=1 Tax=Pelovirga terrestris TaxID=2771352 RepID=A0A8J6QPN9_9BACT|nr:ribonuclease III [Pelovirga terrestris]
MEDNYTQLQQKLGYTFTDFNLIVQALTHKSFSNEQPECVAHNERLEFLGDAVLELAVSDLVYRLFPDIPEGGLTRIRAEVVCEKGLAEIARGLDLGSCLRLGRGEVNNQGFNKPSLLSDALEALLGAVFRDGGFATVCQIVEKSFAAAIDASARLRYGSDHKTCLQERLQAHYNKLPEYRLSQIEGPEHDKVFFMEVHFNNRILGRGRGSSKKSAEQQAAAAALDHPLLKGVAVDDR